jgi:hypothetical protein
MALGILYTGPRIVNILYNYYEIYSTSGIIKHHVKMFINDTPKNIKKSNWDHPLPNG